MNNSANGKILFIPLSIHTDPFSTFSIIHAFLFLCKNCFSSNTCLISSQNIVSFVFQMAFEVCLLLSISLLQLGITQQFLGRKGVNLFVFFCCREVSCLGPVNSSLCLLTSRSDWLFRYPSLHWGLITISEQQPGTVIELILFVALLSGISILLFCHSLPENWAFMYFV